MERAQISLASYAGQKLRADAMPLASVQRMLESGSVFVVMVSLLVLIDLVFNTLIVGCAFLLSCTALLIASWAYRRACIEETRFAKESTLAAAKR